MINVSVLLFPGSNCDHDCIYTYREVLKQNVNVIWHKDTDLKNPDLVVIPGGFTYGDYLRTGALAKLSPVMAEVSEFARKGGPVIGICNGFQILCEAGILPGVLLQNIEMKFISRFVHLEISSTATPFTQTFEEGDVLKCPMAHFEGNYFVDSDTLARIEGEGQVAFRYCGPNGEIEHEDRAFNPNGSVNSIAGVCNKEGNVVGMMPHPDRAVDQLVGHIASDTGRAVFEGVLSL